MLWQTRQSRYSMQDMASTAVLSMHSKASTEHNGMLEQRSCAVCSDYLKSQSQAEQGG